MSYIIGSVKQDTPPYKAAIIGTDIASVKNSATVRRKNCSSRLPRSKINSVLHNKMHSR